MLKKVIAVITACAMLASLASCGCATENVQTTTEASTTASSTSTVSDIPDSTTTTTTTGTSATTSATTADTSPSDSSVTSPTESSVTSESSATITTAKPVTSTTTAPVSSTTTTTTTTVAEEEPTDPIERMEYQYNNSAEKYQNLYTKLEAKLDMPIISVITLDNKGVYSKDEYVTSMIDVLNCDEEFDLSALAGIRVRGNSTAEGSEKPYRIKFEKKQNLLGLHDGEKFKSWVLLKSQWNLAMDYMGFSLADAILEDEYYSSDCTYVNLYINGKFKGIYLLCEQNQVNKNRVDVYEPEEGYTGTDIGYFIEIDNYAESEPYYFTVDYNDNAGFTDISGITRDFVSADYSVKNDLYSSKQLRFIENYTNGVFEILYEAVENNNPLMFDSDYNLVSAEGVYTPQQAVEAVMDTKSLAYLLILDELVHDYDVGEGSFFMAVDFSADSKYKKLTFTAPWDFNWAYNDSAYGGYYASTFQPPIGEQDRSNPWYIVAMKADWFREIVEEKWAELSASNTITNTTSEVKKGVEALENDLGDESWKINSAYDIINFVNGRVNRLNELWG